MDPGKCPTCDKPYGKRRRCYWCHGRQKSGETRTCARCGKDFYAARWQIADTQRRQATYCSRPCLYDARRIDGPGYEYRRTDGYIAVYYPKHPDAPRSGWMLQHRLVAEEKYGRRLLRTEHVNHINGIKDDNRPENLEVITASAHARISTQQGVVQRAAMRAELAALRAEVAEYRRRFGPLEERSD